MSKSYSKK